MRNAIVACLIMMSLTVGVSVLRATPIPLYNTGIGLPDGAVDPNWSLVASADPSAPGPLTYVVTEGQFPLNGPWVPDSLSSKWIGPMANQSTGNLPGAYTYATTFTLPGNLANAEITGLWTSDNDGVEIILNSVVLPDPTSFTAFQSLNNPFTITSGFVAGPNTLEFVVDNGHNDGPIGTSDPSPNPTGLRVELSGEYNTVPEPVTLGLVGLGFCGIGMLRRRFLR